MTGATAVAAAYVAIALLCRIALARRWRGAGTGLRSGCIAALWLPIAACLALYYAAALAYTLAAIAHGRGAKTGAAARRRGVRRAVDVQ